MNGCYGVLFCIFFFFKQKTAYEMLRSLVGSEMCIRDSLQGHGGRHCQLQGCGAFDYLPSHCQICSLYLCGEHAKPSAHGCVRYTRQLPRCPVCQEFILLSGSSEDAAMVQHLDSGCTQHVKKTVEKARRESSRCNFGRGKKRCKDRSLIKLVCDLCEKKFCVKHRNKTVHDCGGPPSSLELVRKFSRDQLVRTLSTDLVRVASDRSVGSPVNNRQI
eukprot:TRINITY_DN14335_c0_g1_i1.p1 TRINITY_DN14335_c0_g1~~TRINITY_DN14335_c0_g1_i1.p1  ORF type:complete len:217 (+),score=45.59 TRINITY_DN14335_c0_g1_i1:52-702(+)